MNASQLVAGRIFLESALVLSGGQSSVVAVSGTSAQSLVITTENVVVTTTVDCFVRQDSNPTAVSDGTDQILLGGNQYRLAGIVTGNKLAFKTTGATGNVYITPGA